ncbi:hypothetical protein BKA70DRAFT_1435263 [Coprinopsis sp. MPI-PUGE-AT-0042]|nr:hypothetical protein BKA70DRAFT_1435263 [Coprinopsis sp. MPI-PUGE-AT-0042]
MDRDRSAKVVMDERQSCAPVFGEALQTQDSWLGDGRDRFIFKRLQEESSDDAGVCPKLRRKLASSMIKILGGQHLTTMHIGHGQCISFLCYCGPSVKHVVLTGCLRPVKLANQTHASKGASNKLALDSLTCVLHPFGRSRLSLRPGRASGNGYLINSHSPIRLESLKELVLESGAFSGGSTLQNPNCSPISFSRLPNLRDLCIQAFGPSLRRSDPFIGLYDDLRPLESSDLESQPFVQRNQFPLERLTIQISFPPCDVCSFLSGKDFQVDWKPLADALSDRTMFPKLRLLVVALSVHSENRLGEGFSSNRYGLGNPAENWEQEKERYVVPLRIAMSSLGEQGRLELRFVSERTRSVLTPQKVV